MVGVRECILSKILGQRWTNQTQVILTSVRPFHVDNPTILIHDKQKAYYNPLNSTNLLNFCRTPTFRFRITDSVQCFPWLKSLISKHVLAIIRHSCEECISSSPKSCSIPWMYRVEEIQLFFNKSRITKFITRSLIFRWEQIFGALKSSPLTREYYFTTFKHFQHV